MNPNNPAIVQLQFLLDVDDGWPPVSVESLPFEIEHGLYRAIQVPLFVKDLSVGDVIEAVLDDENRVSTWQHVRRSDRSTVWLLRINDSDNIDFVLKKLQDLACNTAGLQKLGCFAIDVPASIPIATIDNLLGQLDAKKVAIAFPSWRREED